MDEEAVYALRHVYNDIDTENQWKRATQAIESLSELDKARVWMKLSETVRNKETVDAMVTHSQLRELFKRCVSRAEKQAAEQVIDRKDEERVFCDWSHDLEEIKADLKTAIANVSDIYQIMNFTFETIEKSFRRVMDDPALQRQFENFVRFVLKEQTSKGQSGIV